MTSYNRGDVVLVRFPHAELTGWSRRPALVVQSNALQTELGHYVLAQITTTKRHGPARIVVESHSPAGQAMGLPQDSVVVVDMLQATKAGLIERTLGHCPIMPEVDAALRLVLAL